MAKQIKARNWTAVLYPDSMITNWQDRIYRQIQVPFEYIIHDKDSVELEEDEREPRKTHIHLVLHYGNNTTYKAVLEHLQDNLSSLGNHCCNKVEPVRNLKYMHRYLTHDTEDSRKAGKYQYNVSEIVSGNNWDLGAFVSLEDFQKLEVYQKVRDFMFLHKLVTVYDLEVCIESGAFDDLLPDFTSQQILETVVNNRQRYVQVAKELNFKFKKGNDND